MTSTAQQALIKTDKPQTILAMVDKIVKTQSVFHGCTLQYWTENWIFCNKLLKMQVLFYSLLQSKVVKGLLGHPVNDLVDQKRFQLYMD